MSATSIRHWTPDLAGYIGGFVGIKYLDLGTTREGVYCAGLVVLFYRDNGIEIPDPATDSWTEGINSPFTRCWRQASAPTYGDMVTMRGEEDFVQGHVGIWTPLGVLHALRRSGVVLSKRQKVTGIYRYEAPPCS